MYRHNDLAYSSMDMSGKGFIDLHSFVNSIAAKRIVSNFNGKSQKYKIDLKDIEEYCVTS